MRKLKDNYNSWYDNFGRSIETFDDDKLYETVYSLLRSGKNSFAFNRKLMEKSIDVSWVEAIENGMLYLDNVLRSPRRTIEDVEEIVPIALSRKITVESVKHLAQHTDYIQSIDERGRIMPSKILNIYKEDSLMTYENKFVNTLVDRLYIFVNRRYEKLAEVRNDEEVFTIQYDSAVDSGRGNKMNISMKIETVNSLETMNDQGYTVWERVEKIRKTIEGYKGSTLCQTLGNTYIRPPVMRTNAIMKNVDLKACLTLWQYIEGYDAAGFEINILNTAKKPDEKYIDDVYKLAALNFILFNAYTGGTGRDAEELKTQKNKPVTPKILKQFDKETAEKYSICIGTGDEEGSGFEGTGNSSSVPANTEEIAAELEKIIQTEKDFLEAEEERRIAAQRAAAEAERKRIEAENRRLEQERIEEEMRLERERIQREKEEEERRIQEMLERKRAEQEAAERAAQEERERLEREEQERLAEEQRRAEEERKKREEEERIEAEKQRIREDKKLIREELGNAEDENFKKEEEKEEPEVPDEPEEIESPEAVAKRAKEEQQKRELERRETERAQRLKAERTKFESKDFREIYREYSKNPVYLVPRTIRNFYMNVLGFIPDDTDNPDLRAKLAKKKEEALIAEEKKRKQNEMEVLYEKYASNFKYRYRRFIKDMQFKKKKKLERKNNPRPPYVPPARTAQEQQEINDMMRRLYREYHVSIVEKIRRKLEEIAIKRRMNS